MTPEQLRARATAALALRPGTDGDGFDFFANSDECVSGCGECMARLVVGMPDDHSDDCRNVALSAALTDYAAALEREAQNLERETTALTVLRSLYDALGDLYGDPEDCDDCGDLDQRPCRLHGEAFIATYHALQAAAEVLGPCRCGHHASEHYDEDTTRCKVCDCYVFTLAALHGPADTTQSIDNPKEQ